MRLLMLGLAFFAVAARAVEPGQVQQHAFRLLEVAEAARQSGMAIPPDLMPTVTRGLSATANHNPETLSKLDELLAAYEEEVGRWSQAPGFAGTATLAPADLIAGDKVNLTLTYRPGTMLGEGAAIMVATHWLYPHRLQHRDPNASNYVSVTISGSGARLVSDVSIRQGINGGLEGPEVTPVFELREGSVGGGEAVTIRYRNLELPAQSYEAFPFPLYVRLQEGGHWYHIPPVTTRIRAGPVSSVTMATPLVIRAGQSFPVTLRLEDQFGNLANGQFPSFDVLVDGRFVSRVPAGSDPMPVFRQQFAATGSYELDLRSSGGGLRVTRRLAVTQPPGFDVRFVELRAHSADGDEIATETDIQARFAGLVEDVMTINADTYQDRYIWQARKDNAIDGDPDVTMDGFERAAEIESGGGLLILAGRRITFDQAPRARFPLMVDLLGAFDPATTLAVALPETPTDLRMIDARLMRLVEIKSGDATFEWFGNKVAGAGYRVGFTGSSTFHHDHLGTPAHTGRTALLMQRDESVLDALKARRTYVTSGPGILLDTTVNGGAPGSRVAASQVRHIRGRVAGSAPIQSVALVKNGEVIETRRYGRSPDATTLQLTFEAPVAPLEDRRDLPRNGREWIGFVRTSGVDIAGIDTPGFRNRVRQAAAINPSDAQRVDFITWTRGHPSSFMLEFSAVPEDMVVELTLRAGHEDVDQIPLTRQPAMIPGVRMQTSIDELRQGPVTRLYEVEGYQDSVTFDLIDKELPTEVNFEFTDRVEYGAGDYYYYVRVRQTDDHFAWSSPVWVGGFDPE